MGIIGPNLAKRGYMRATGATNTGLRAKLRHLYQLGLFKGYFGALLRLGTMTREDMEFIEKLYRDLEK